MLIVVTDGELVWDERAGDFARSSAVAPELRGGFAEEPSWVDATWSRSAPANDPRLEDVTAGLTSAIKDVPKDELFAAAVREHRRTMRLATTGLLSLVALLMVAAIAGVIAYTQRNTARSQATLAVSRQLAAVSAGQLASNLDVSLLLAVEAVRRDDNPQARSALMAAAFASPHLVRYFNLPDRVTTVAGSANGRVLAAGLADGRVMRWEPGRSTPREIAKLPNAITQVAIDARGDAVVATDGSTFTERSSALLVRDAGAPRPLTAPEGQRPASVGISPSGRTVMLFGGAPVDDGARSISVVDGRAGERRDLHDATRGPRSVNFVVPSDEEVVLLDVGYGGWERRVLATWTTIDRGGVALGARQAAGEPSADGEFLTATNGLSTIPVWRTRGAPENQRPDLTSPPWRPSPASARSR